MDEQIGVNSTQQITDPLAPPAPSDAEGAIDETVDGAPNPLVAPETVSVAVAGPPYLSRFVFDGSLVITRGGTRVPADQLDALSAAAGRAGVALKIGD